MRKKLQEIKQRFIETMEVAAEIVGVSPSELKRDEYIRATVDNSIDGRLNKEDLSVIGTFSVAKNEMFPEPEEAGPKILVLDIETAPLEAAVWSMWQNNIGLNQINSDWFIMSYTAKWFGEDEIFYNDQRKFKTRKEMENDKQILEDLWKLLDECDFVLGQNSKKFDIPKINARFILNDMKPPSSYRHIDTKKIADANFGFTSKKLEYMSAKINKKYKKLKHSKYAGQEMWTQCLSGNLDAWKCMQEYNTYDVLSTEELWVHMAPWDSSINFSVYNGGVKYKCTCGNEKLEECGFYYTNSAKYQKYRCTKCGREVRDKKNLLDKNKCKNMKMSLTRHR